MSNSKVELYTNKVIERKKYTLYVKEYNNKQCLSFTLVPHGILKKKLLNVSFCLAATVFVLYFLHSRLGLNYGKRFWCIAACSLLLTNVITKAPRCDTVTVIKGCGIQLSNTVGWNFLPHTLNKRFGVTKHFIPRDLIVDIIINEGFQPGFQVVFYLALMVKKETKLKLIFPVCIFVAAALHSTLRKYLTNNFK